LKSLAVISVMRFTVLYDYMKFTKIWLANATLAVLLGKENGKIEVLKENSSTDIAFFYFAHGF